MTKQYRRDYMQSYKAPQDIFSTLGAALTRQNRIARAPVVISPSQLTPNKSINAKKVNPKTPDIGTDIEYTISWLIASVGLDFTAEGNVAFNNASILFNGRHLALPNASDSQTTVFGDLYPLLHGHIITPDPLVLPTSITFTTTLSEVAIPAPDTSDDVDASMFEEIVIDIVMRQNGVPVGGINSSIGTDFPISARSGTFTFTGTIAGF